MTWFLLAGYLTIGAGLGVLRLVQWGEYYVHVYGAGLVAMLSPLYIAVYAIIWPAIEAAEFFSGGG